MSLATTIAQAAARSAELAWREHRRICAQCYSARAARRPGRRCADGQQMAADAARARAAADREAAADRAPAIGQGTLFGQDDLFA
jgi:hypothetical protein